MRRDRPLDEGNFAPHLLREEHDSNVRRYAAFVIGEFSWPRLLKYEAITTLFGRVPGALGFFLRKLFYPMLFERIGRDVAFGPDVVIRHPHRIRIGDGVFIDAQTFIDGRGAGEEGLVLEDNVILGRGVYIQAKVGPVRVGRGSKVGSGTMIVSQGGVSIGEEVSIAGGCKISGGMFRWASAGESEHERERYTSGPIRIEDRCMLASRAMVLDGVTIGEGAMIGAGTVVTGDVPPGSIVSPRPPVVIQSPGEQAPVKSPLREEGDGAREGKELVAEGVAARTVGAIFAALEEVNEQLPAQARLPKSLDTRLLGEEDALDSLSLVNLLVSVEEKVEEAYGKSISLGDVGDDSSKENPLATVESLARYVDTIRQR